MALIEFEDLPSTNAPINAENLNNNFNSIVESGSNENGRWIKFADGTLICTQQITLTDVPCTTSWGSMYVYAEASGTNHIFPQPFIEVPIGFSVEIAQISGGNGFWLADYGRRHVRSNNWEGICLIRPTSANITATLSIVAIGRWK